MRNLTISMGCFGVIAVLLSAIAGAAIPLAILAVCLRYLGLI